MWWKYKLVQNKKVIKFSSVRISSYKTIYKLKY